MSFQFAHPFQSARRGLPPFPGTRSHWRGRAALACLLSAASMGAAHSQTLDLKNYSLTFRDNFDALDISALGPGTRWTAHTPWNGDFGDAVFDDPGPAGPFSKAPNGLRITASKDASGKWHSGLISSMDKDGAGQSGFAQQYGYFEMRAKMPEGPGVWPAFWLIGTDKSKAASEIDVVEFYGVGPEYYHNWLHHFIDGKDILSKENLVKAPKGLLTGAFNNFGVLVEPDRIKFYLNREIVWDTPTPPSFHQPFYILANLALGGGWPTDKLASPAVFEIEYIAAYQLNSRLTAPVSASSTAPGN